ncbi:WD40 repeat-like protein [Heliocybe sulcata]|uniref:WD40 repeat-like protein n=1 Tax=Heliocybe sulcata TaxID=5364 RepID=A0A5C3NC34_9AGAM|nr:WD40 repeat-like protein [Heliocybe sulcata]
MLSSADFFNAYEFKLEHDFEKDGEQPSWAAGGPQSWGSEKAKLSLDADVNSIAMTQDGSKLAVCLPKEFRVYDTTSLSLLQTVQCPHPPNVSFSPDGEIVAMQMSFVEDRRYKQFVTLIRLKDGTSEDAFSLLTIKEAAQSGAAAASAVLSQRWSDSDIESAHIVDHFTNALLNASLIQQEKHGKCWDGHIPGFGCYPFSNDGKLLFSIKPDRKTVAVVDVQETLHRGYTESFSLVGHEDAVMFVGQSPDGKLLATSAWDKFVCLWNPLDGKNIRVLAGATGQSWAACFSPDSQLIAAGSGDTHVRIWKTATGELLHKLGGFTGWIRTMQFHPEGTHLVTGAEGGTVRVFEVVSGESVQFWQLAGGRGIGAFLEIPGVRWLGDRILIRIPDGSTVVYDVQRHRKWELVAPKPANGRGPYNHYGQPLARFGGKVVYSADHDQAVRVWELD